MTKLSRFFGKEGIPFFTKDTTAPNLLECELIQRGWVEVYVFDLACGEQVEKYSKILNECASGLADISCDETRWCEATQNWKVLLKILRYYLTSKDENLYLGKDGVLYE